LNPLNRTTLVFVIAAFYTQTAFPVSCPEKADRLLRSDANVESASWWHTARLRDDWDRTQFSKVIRQLLSASNIEGIDPAQASLAMIELLAKAESNGAHIKIARASKQRLVERMKILIGDLPESTEYWMSQPMIEHSLLHSKVKDLARALANNSQKGRFSGYLPQAPSIQWQGKMLNKARTVMNVGNGRSRVEISDLDALEKMLLHDLKIFREIADEIEPRINLAQASYFRGLDMMLGPAGFDPLTVDAALDWAIKNPDAAKIDAAKIAAAANAFDVHDVVSGIIVRARKILDDTAAHPSLIARQQLEEALSDVVRGWQYNASMVTYRHASNIWNSVMTFHKITNTWWGNALKITALGGTALSTITASWAFIQDSRRAAEERRKAEEEKLKAEAYERNTPADQKAWDAKIKELKTLKVEIADKSFTIPEFYTNLKGYLLKSEWDPATKFAIALAVDMKQGNQVTMPPAGPDYEKYLKAMARVFQIHDLLMFGLYDPENPSVSLMTGFLSRTDIRQDYERNLRTISEMATKDGPWRFGLPSGMDKYPFMPPKPKPVPKTPAPPEKK
jgi:hypothetical protein